MCNFRWVNGIKMHRIAHTFGWCITAFIHNAFDSYFGMEYDPHYTDSFVLLCLLLFNLGILFDLYGNSRIFTVIFSMPQVEIPLYVSSEHLLTHYNDIEICIYYTLRKMRINSDGACFRR